MNTQEHHDPRITTASAIPDEEDDGLPFPYSMTEIANALTEIDMACMIPLLQIWKLEMTDSPNVENAQHEYYPAMGVSKIRFNRKWAKRNLKNVQEVVCILMHECFHPLLGYLDTWDPYLVEAWEILINQLIWVTVKGKPAYLSILRRLFAREPFPTNFRCDKGRPSGYLQKKVYRCLYNYRPTGPIPGTNVKDSYYSTREEIDLPVLCTLIDPYTLADFIAGQFPEERRLPRSKDEFIIRNGKLPEILAGEKTPTEDKESEESDELSDLLKEVLEKVKPDFGRTTYGDMPGKTPDGSTPVEKSIPDQIGIDILEKLGDNLKEDVKENFPPAGTKKNEAEETYDRNVPGSVRKKMGDVYEKKYGKRPKPEKIKTYDIAEKDLKDALEQDFSSLGKEGGPAGLGGAGMLGRIAIKKQVRVKRTKLGKDMKPIVSLSEFGKIKSLMKQWARKELDRRPQPNFRKDRVAAGMFTQGRLPTRYKQPARSDSKGLVHVYVDASGSVSSCMPQFYAFLLDIQEWIADPIHVFSTEVFDISRRQALHHGVFETTGGTSFSCILNHMKDKGIKNALVITDGYMWCTEEEMIWARKEKLNFVTLLTPQYSDECPLYYLSVVKASIDKYKEKEPSVK